VFHADLARTAAFLRTCDLLVTSSSGPWHLAAALDVPTVAVLTPSDASFWAPVSGRHAWISSDADDVRGISVDAVQDAVVRHLERLTPQTLE
jgi:ADP-heptose:LPS heptosyltransferase